MSYYCTQETKEYYIKKISGQYCTQEVRPKKKEANPKRAKPKIEGIV